MASTINGNPLAKRDNADCQRLFNMNCGAFWTALGTRFYILFRPYTRTKIDAHSSHSLRNCGRNIDNLFDDLVLEETDYKTQSKSAQLSFVNSAAILNDTVPPQSCVKRGNP